jgi:hypothetical protein
MSSFRAIVLLAGLGLGLAVSLGGCARHVHHHHGAAAKTVVVLDQEHEDRNIVVVHKRPHAGRYCWQHKAHWHCRAH